jgi:hypothetical protein
VFCFRRIGHLSAFLTVTSVACAAQRPAAVASIRASGPSDDSPICKALLDRFVGVPGLDDAPTNALAGRWWIRGCSAEHVGSGLRLRLRGPGWYFVDQRGSDFAVRQQVPFTLGIELQSAPELTVTNGIAALSFAVEAPPQVDLQLECELSVRPTSAWGSLLSVAPLVPVRDMAADRLSSAAVSALRAQLRGGATATYDFRSGQADVGLGKLRPGQVPAHPFSDRVPWLVNDRLSLPPQATHVVGPIAPGATRLDVRVERGEGLAYRAVCRDDMPGEYSAIASGRLDLLPTHTSAAHGTLTGLGEHSATFFVERCAFFIVVSPLGSSMTVAALRVRG